MYYMDCVVISSAVLGGVVVKMTVSAVGYQYLLWLLAVSYS